MTGVIFFFSLLALLITVASSLVGRFRVRNYAQAIGYLAAEAIILQAPGLLEKYFRFSYSEGLAGLGYVFIFGPIILLSYIFIPFTFVFFARKILKERKIENPNKTLDHTLRFWTVLGSGLIIFLFVSLFSLAFSDKYLSGATGTRKNDFSKTTEKLINDSINTNASQAENVSIETFFSNPTHYHQQQVCVSGRLDFLGSYGTLRSATDQRTPAQGREIYIPGTQALNGVSCEVGDRCAGDVTLCGTMLVAEQYSSAFGPSYGAYDHELVVANILVDGVEKETIQLSFPYRNTATVNSSTSAPIGKTNTSTNGYPAITVSNQKITVDGNMATITWETDVPTGGIFYYGIAYVTEHSVQVDGYSNKKITLTFPVINGETYKYSIDPCVLKSDGNPTCAPQDEATFVAK